MGTYINCKAKKEWVIEWVNDLWNRENSGYENTFHLLTVEETKEWLENIHTDPKLKHLRYIKTTEQLNKVFPLWGTGTFQIKITLGDYLCSEMAKRYLRFFKKHGDFFFEENPLKDDSVRGILEEMVFQNHKAEDCLVECSYCKGGQSK